MVVETSRMLKFPENTYAIGIKNKDQKQINSESWNESWTPSASSKHFLTASFIVVYVCHKYIDGSSSVNHISDSLVNPSK